MSLERVRVPKNGILSWLAEKFGFENYEQEQVGEILESLAKLLRACGSVELDFLGRFLLRLSEHPESRTKLIRELERKGY